MKTYVINLPQSIERRQSIELQLKKLPELQIEFFPAVDGRRMSEEEILQRFDVESAFKYYGRIPMKGEIGCTLSHMWCYQTILSSNDKYALILEDDIKIRDFSVFDISSIERILNKDERPIIVLLSGHYWFLPFKGKANWKRVFSAWYTHSYVINRAAAKILCEKLKRPWHIADNWVYIRSLGICVYAVSPHWIDQTSTSKNSTVKDIHGTRLTEGSKLSIKAYLCYLYNVLIMERLLKILGLFEKD